jgi:hypothetical protein
MSLRAPHQGGDSICAMKARAVAMRVSCLLSVLSEVCLADVLLRMFCSRPHVCLAAPACWPPTQPPCLENRGHVSHRGSNARRGEMLLDVTSAASLRYSELDPCLMSAASCGICTFADTNGIVGTECTPMGPRKICRL